MGGGGDEPNYGENEDGQETDQRELDPCVDHAISSFPCFHERVANRNQDSSIGNVSRG